MIGRKVIVGTFMHIIRALLVLIMAIAQAVVAYVPLIMGWDRTISSSAELFDSPLVPAGYAFAIWGLLYLGSFLFALWQLFSPRRAEPEVGTVAWLAFGAFTASTVWAIHQPLFGPGPLSFAVLEVILLFAVLAVVFSRRIDGLGIGDRLAILPLFALAGWLLVASAPAFSLALRSLNLGPLFGSLAAESLVLLLAWLLPAALIAFVVRSIAFAAAVSWGLVAVALANEASGETMLIQALYGAIGVVAVATVLGLITTRGGAAPVYE